MANPTWERAEKVAERRWSSNRLGWLILLLPTALAGYWTFYIPAPGYAVAALGFMAAVMTIRTMPHTQKVLCTLAIFALLVAELRAIKKDRDVSTREQSDARAKENAAFKAVADSFAKTESEFNSLHKRFDQSAQTSHDAREDSRRQFDALLNRYRGMFNNITGGDSYAYLAVQEGDVSSSGMAVAICNPGKYILTGVTVQIVRVTGNPNTWDVGSGPQLAIGTLYPGQIRMAGARIKPDVGADGVDKYWVFIAAQNGLISQMIYVRPRKDSVPLPWAYKFEVARITYWKTGSKTGSTSTPIMAQPWTDETNPQRKFYKQQRKVFIPK
jgi:hypothetical protein